MATPDLYSLDHCDQLSEQTANSSPLRLMNSNGANCAFNSLFQVLVNVPQLYKSCARLTHSDFSRLKSLLNVYKRDQSKFYLICTNNNQDPRTIRQQISNVDSQWLRSQFTSIFPAFQPNDKEQLDSHELLTLLFSRIDAVDAETKCVHPLFTRVGVQTYYKDQGKSKTPLVQKRLELAYVDPKHEKAYTAVSNINPSVVTELYDWHLFIEIPTIDNDTNNTNLKINTDNNNTAENQHIMQGRSKYFYNNSSQNYLSNYNNNNLSNIPWYKSDPYAQYPPASLASRLRALTTENKLNIANNDYSYFSTQLFKWFDITITESKDDPALYLNAQDNQLHDYIPTRQVRHFYEAPNFLCVCVKRLKYVEQNNKMVRMKINDNFPVPLHFHMHDIPSNKSIVHKYVLQAFISHIGFHFETGHYIAHVKNGLNQWYCCNDSTVQMNSVADIKKTLLSSYILFYQKEL